MFNFNQNTKLLGLTLWQRPREEDCTNVSSQKFAKEKNKKKNFCGFALTTEPSIKSPDVLTHHCGSPAGVKQRMLGFS